MNIEDTDSEDDVRSEDEEDDDDLSDEEKEGDINDWEELIATSNSDSLILYLGVWIWEECQQIRIYWPITPHTISHLFANLLSVVSKEENINDWGRGHITSWQSQSCDNVCLSCF